MKPHPHRHAPLRAAGLTAVVALLLGAVVVNRATRATPHEAQNPRLPVSPPTKALAHPVELSQPAIAESNSAPEAPATNPRDAGYQTIAALQRAGRFDEAARFATTSESSLHRDLVNAAFYEWARTAPERALQSAIALPEAAERTMALQSALSGWARTDPEGLAELALRLPDGEEKSAALTKAFRSWMIQDPAKAGDWILSHPAQLAIAENVFRTENR